MYFNLLKKDLKRKKTMNVILLTFIILSSTFISSSVNNILAVTKALDFYFEKAKVSDYVICTLDKGEQTIIETVEKIQEVKSYKAEKALFAGSDLFRINGKDFKQQNTSVITPFEERGIEFFDLNDQALKTVEKGTVYISQKVFKDENINVGDKIEIALGDKTLTLTICGAFKDAILGSELMGMTRFVLNDEDFSVLYSNEALNNTRGTICYVMTDNVEAISKGLDEESSIVFAESKEMVKKTYVMDMVIAGVLLVVSVCLILVAFVVLAFSISFTLSEEYREIGIMKAIGIKTRKIRGLYIVKYLAISLSGATLGFFLSIPFSKLLLSSVSESMVIGNDNKLLINLLCAVFVAVIILLFSYVCTGKVKKFSSIDAIRNGMTGERFTKKSVIRLEKYPFNPYSFMALNDVLSSPRRYFTIILTYTICLSLVLILENTVNTLKSDVLITTFGMTQSDAYYGYSNDEMLDFMSTEGKALFEEKLLETEKILADNNMSAKCHVDIIFKLPVRCGDKSARTLTMQGLKSTADMYEYYEGTAPQNENEVAITGVTANEIGANIGDTIKITHSFGEREYIVTALFQNMNNLGEGIRLHENAETDYGQSSGFMGIQVDFTDNPCKKTVRERIDKLNEIYKADAWFTAAEYVEEIVGVSGTLDSVKKLVLFVALIIVILVTILMEMSFIEKEKKEIGILKAVGFNNAFLVKWHTLRFVIIGVASNIISVLLTVPLTKLSVTPVFKMMGAFYGIEYVILPFNVFFAFPIIILGITILSAILTSTSIRKITATESVNGD